VGDYQLQISAKGYGTQKKAVTIKENEITSLDVTLKKGGANFTDALGIEWVWVAGGSFDMGCTSEQSGCYDDEKQVHTVTVDGFYMSKYEVTVTQFEEFINATNYRTDAEKNGYSWIWTGSKWKKKNGVTWRDDVNGNQRPKSEYDHPVIHVSWNDAVAFCKWLSGKTGTTIRLPTEAEWEYAARGGRKSRHYKYAGSNDVDAVAWYRNNSGKKTHLVGQKQPNELGLYDMSGNVCEWCMDWYGKNFYSQSPRNNPLGPDSGSFRVFRGGSWSSSAGSVRVAGRRYFSPSYSGCNLGFRLLRTR
jgi:formylglycine-generating enzyme required for sulfatase activity